MAWRRVSITFSSSISSFLFFSIFEKKRENSGHQRTFQCPHKKIFFGDSCTNLGWNLPKQIQPFPVFHKKGKLLPATLRVHGCFQVSRPNQPQDHLFSNPIVVHYHSYLKGNFPCLGYFDDSCKSIWPKMGKIKHFCFGITSFVIILLY